MPQRIPFDSSGSSRQARLRARVPNALDEQVHQVLSTRSRTPSSPLELRTRRPVPSIGTKYQVRSAPPRLSVSGQNPGAGPVFSRPTSPGSETAFEAAFSEAAPIIASMRGCLSHELQRCIETPSRYILLVEWRSLEDHTVGFRGSAEYQHWKRLLHHFYDPFPTVKHYERTSSRLHGA